MILPLNLTCHLVSHLHITCQGRGHGARPLEVRGALRLRLEAGSSWQKSEVRDQTSEVRLKLISDLRLLTSVIDDFYDFYGFYDFYDLPLIAHHFRRKIFIIRPKKAVNITKAAMSPIGTATKTLSFKTNMSRGTKTNRISPITISARHPVRKSLLNPCSTGFSSISFIVPYP